jgi:hypothetical protein
MKYARRVRVHAFDAHYKAQRASTPTSERENIFRTLLSKDIFKKHPHTHQISRAIADDHEDIKNFMWQWRIGRDRS